MSILLASSLQSPTQYAGAGGPWLMRLLILKKVALAKFQTIAGLQKKVPDQLLVYGIGDL